jgi:hypothetical protein
MLASIRGISPKLAIAILSQAQVEELAQAIVEGNRAQLRRISGVSHKMAGSLVLELKSQMDSFILPEHAEIADEGRSSKRRELIPEAVRLYVWRRDGGKCIKCGSIEKLEYDHIIPVAKGGSSTERNVQLLCEMCNRAKGANL